MSAKLCVPAGVLVQASAGEIGAVLAWVYLSGITPPSAKDELVRPIGAGRPLVGPAGIPADITEILRRAFLTMAEDKDYQTDALKVELPVGSPIGGAQISRLISKLAQTTTPDVVAEFSRLAGAR